MGDESSSWTTRRSSTTVHTYRKRHQNISDFDGDDWEIIEVIDTGPGIPLQKQEFIFEGFSRIGGNTKPDAGLGPAISRVLAEALGGHIAVESEMGRGSTFTLWLPIHSAKDAVPQLSPARVLNGIAGTAGEVRENLLPSS